MYLASSPTKICFFQLIVVLVSLVLSSEVLKGDGDQLCLVCQNCSHSFRSHWLDGDVGQLKSIFVEYIQNEDSKSCHFFNQLENFIVADIPFLLKQENMDTGDKYSRISVVFNLFLSVARDNYKLKSNDRSFDMIKAALQQLSDTKIRDELLQILSQEITKQKERKTKTKKSVLSKNIWKWHVQLADRSKQTWYLTRSNFCLLCRDEPDHTFLKHVWEHSLKNPIGYFAQRYFEIHEDQRNHVANYMERVNTFVSIEIEDLLKDSKFHPNGDKKGVLFEVFDQLIAVYKNFHDPKDRSIHSFYSKLKGTVYLVKDGSIRKDLLNVLIARLEKDLNPQLKYSLSFRISKHKNLNDLGELSQISDQTINASQQAEYTLDRILPSIDQICEWTPSFPTSQSPKHVSDLDFYQKNPTSHCSQNYKSSTLTRKKTFVLLKARED